MNASRLMATALTLSVLAAAMIVAGCAGTGSPTPTPAPSATPTPTPAPTISPVDREYQYVERLQSGVDHYNSAVEFMRTGKNLTNASDYTNASRYMLMSSDRMGSASSDFVASLQFASSPQEISLSRKWAETANYSAMSYQNASDAYGEYAYQIARPTPNLVKYNYYVDQANYYSGLAAESRRQVDALLANITFVVPTSAPLQ